jgi:GTPase SAR1 family protein
MGIRLSSEDREAARKHKEKSKALEEQLREASQKDKVIHKLLLLGAGESGKSTLFKQVNQIYGKGYDEEAKRSFTRAVYENTIQAIKTLSAQSVKYGGVQSPAAVEAKGLIDALQGDETVDSRLAAAINTLWSDPAVRAAFARKSSFQIIDSCEYFMSRVHLIGAAGYIPTEQDILRTRVKTTGIVEQNFTIDGSAFRIVDVGGQRNERKKWIHCFESVTAVVFVIALSGYDQMLYEDEKTNRMAEALNLFDEMVNSRWFREASFILFLNKADLFREKIAKVSLKVCFPEYEGANTYEEGVQFIERKFLERNRGSKLIYPYITCATDTGTIGKVLTAVKDIVIRKSLEEASLGY